MAGQPQGGSERYRLLVEGMDDFLLVLLDPAGLVVRCNAAMDRILGRLGPGLEGRPWSCLFRPEEVAEGLPQDLLARAGTTGRAEREGWFLRPEGNPFYARTVLSAYHDHRGILQGFALFGQDLGAQEPAWSSLAALEQDLAARTRDLRQLEAGLQGLQRMEALGVLAGGIAHDVNNLLGAMGGNLELAQDEASPAELQAWLRSLQGLVAQSSSLVRRLLDFGRQGGRAEQTVEVNALVRELVPILAPALPRRPRLRLELFPAPLTVWGEPVLLQQVVLNLVLNSAEAIPGTAGLITLSTFPVPPEPAAPSGPEGTGQAQVGLTVRDNGAGMGPEVLGRIFEPFFTTKPEGHGLGLAALQGIVRRHRGSIQVTSTPGRGSCFKVLLPLAAGPAPA